ncbi:MAG: ABC transporter C-terminal domain-containing protein, partial [Solirubrobacteraceae bacterium]
DEYLRLRAAESAAGISRTPASVGSATPAGKSAPAGTAAANGTAPATAETTPALSGAALRDAQKEVAAVERRVAKLTGQINDAKNALATHDHSDYQGLTKRMKEIAALEADVEALEERWFELTEALG